MKNVNKEVSCYVKLWVNRLADERRYSHHTVSGYHSDLKYFFSFLSEYKGGKISIKILECVSLQLFRGWLTYRHRYGYSLASTARALGSIRSFFSFLNRNSIKNSAIDCVLTPKLASNLPRALTEEEAFDMLEQIEKTASIKWEGKRDKAFLTLLYGSGMRIAEALSLQVRDVPKHIAGTYSTVICGKGNKERMVFFLPIVQERILDYLKSCPHKQRADSPLFLGRKGKALNAGIFQRSLRITRMELGLADTVTPHAFRHSFATHLLNNGANIVEIQKLLGHSSIRSTQRYTKITAIDIMASYAKHHPNA